MVTKRNYQIYIPDDARALLLKYATERGLLRAGKPNMSRAISDLTRRVLRKRYAQPAAAPATNEAE